MQTLNFASGLYNYREFSQPLESFYQAMYKQKKRFLKISIK